MIKDVDLLGYLPPQMGEFYELQKITEAENPEFTALWKANEQIRKDLYILTAEEKGLQRFEKLIGLFPTENDTFDSRRSRILSRWNDSVPYTMLYLIGVINVITGGNYEINENFKEYQLEIITHIAHYGGIDDLQYILKTVIPCNIHVTSINALEISPTWAVGIGITTINVTKYFISCDYNKTYELSGNIKGGGAFEQNKSVVVTNDFNASVNISGKISKVGGAFNVNNFTITNDFNAKAENETELTSRNTVIVVTKQNI